MKKTVVLLSGGLDSVTLAFCLRQDRKILPISFNYGQRHSRELTSSQGFAQLLNVPWKLVDLTDVTQLMRGSSQTDASIEVPEGHYAHESMKLTVVPNRNMIMLAVAGAYAVSEGADSIAFAAHAGDHAIYPDCRPDFVNAMQVAFHLANYHPVLLEAPFLNKTKGDIVKLGTLLDVPYELTWSCYKGADKHCGKCGTCVERIEAFQQAGVKDPTNYAG